MDTRLNKKTGLWLDHAQAHFIDVSRGPAIIETMYCDQKVHEHFAGKAGTGTRLGGTRSTNNEYNKHNVEREVMHVYYKTLADRLLQYDDIYLIGPTAAKDELYNILMADKSFAGKTIRVQACDKLTENQLIAKVKQFFNV